MYPPQKPPVPNQGPLQQQERRLPKKQDEHQITWNHGSADVTKLLKDKVDKVREKGHKYLVGEIANLIAENIYKNPAQNYVFDEISFCPNNRQNASDIRVNYGTYVNIIEEMVKNCEANNKTAEKILENLSKKYTSLESAAYEFFADIPRNSGARKLMAVLICETIRCNDDGACVRAAMREIVDWYVNNSGKENDPLPFEAVFTGKGASKSLPQAIFSFAGGKPRIQQQVLQKPKFGSPYKKYYDEDAKNLELQKKYISDSDEETTPQSYSYQRVSNQPYMETRNNGKHSQGVYEDTPSAIVSAASSAMNTPVRPKRNMDGQLNPQLSPLLYEKKRNEPVNFSAWYEFDENQVHTSDHQEEYNEDSCFQSSESPPDLFRNAPQEGVTWTQKKCFCENCNMFYYGRVPFNNEYLKKCPNCNSGNVRKINDENVEQFIYTHFGNTNFQYVQANGLPQPFEGYFIEEILR